MTVWSISPVRLAQAQGTWSRPSDRIFLLAWVVFPALMLVLSAGAGLVVRRATGPAAVPALLVVPVGLAALVVVGGPVLLLRLAGAAGRPACAVVGVLGCAGTEVAARA